MLYTLLKYDDIQKAVDNEYIQLDEFGDKFISRKSTSQSVPCAYPSPPKVSSCNL